MPPVATIRSVSRVGHQRLDQRDRRLLDHLQAAVGGAGRDRRSRHQPDRLGTRGRAIGWGETTTALRVISAQQHLEVGRRHRVRRWRQREDHAGRLGHLDQLAAPRRPVRRRSPRRRNAPRARCEHASFLRRLCSATPIPVSSTASCANRSAFWKATSARPRRSPACVRGRRWRTSSRPSVRAEASCARAGRRALAGAAASRMPASSGLMLRPPFHGATAREHRRVPCRFPPSPGQGPHRRGRAPSGCPA